MGRKSRQREEEMLANDRKIMDGLRSHASQRKNRVEAITWEKVIFPAIKTYRTLWINDPSTWVNTRKTKNMDTLRLDMVRYVFGIYRCPSFLEKVWLPTKDEPHHVRERENVDIEYTTWYLTVAQGGSLFKTCTKGILSKKETHAFIHGPKKYTIKQNIWWARAFCESNENLGIANRIAQSGLVGRAIDSEFWISVMRFFVRFPTTLNEMNDLIDYFRRHALIENENYSLKGRSLEAVRRSCEEWHRFLNKQASIGGGTWPGSELDNWQCTTGKDEHKIRWKMTQINSGNALLKEGQKMRHCVVSYKRDCVNGKCSIWSLSSADMNGNAKRNLTVELTSRGEVTQARGLANRGPRPNEEAVLRKWCSVNGLRRRENHYW